MNDKFRKPLINRISGSGKRTVFLTNYALKNNS